MGCVNRDQLLKSIDLAREEFQVPGYEEFGHFVVRELTGIEQIEVASKSREVNGAGGAAKTLTAWVSACVCDDGGNRLFDAADVEKLPANLLTALYQKASSVNKLDIEDEAKNSKTVPTDNS